MPKHQYVPHSVRKIDLLDSKGYYRDYFDAQAWVKLVVPQNRQDRRVVPR